MIDQKASIQVNTSIQRELNIDRVNLYQTTKAVKIKELMKYIGPAFIISVAYIDPPNTSRGTFKRA